MPKISIITPAYNASRFIGETIESVLIQSFKDWEMIIVDDCSKDNTFEIAESYARKDSRIKVIKNSENLRVAATRNVALDVATGEYIAFLDSDDIWMPDKLEKQLRFMEDNDYVLTYTDFQKYYTNTGERGKIIRAPNVMTKNKIAGNTAIGCLTVMVNRNKVGVFHMPLLNHCEDNCTWYEITSRGYKAYRLPEVLSLYRVTEGSLTHDKQSAAKKQWNVYKDYYHFGFVKCVFYFAKYAFHAVLREL